MINGLVNCAGVIGLLLIGASLVPHPAQAQTRQVSQYSADDKAHPRIAAESLPPQVAALSDFHARLHLFQNCSRLMVTRSSVIRTFVANPRIAEVVQFRPNELALNGLETGCTTVTLWFDKATEPLIYLLEVVRPQVNARPGSDNGMVRGDEAATVMPEPGRSSQVPDSAPIRHPANTSAIPQNAESDLRSVKIRPVSRPGGGALPAIRYDGHAPWPEVLRNPARDAVPTGFSGNRAPHTPGNRRAP